ncbi:hypothetical protein SEA_SQUIDDLY_87 [Gordonia phage Squiddly]|nr:hypothetical protein SEA_SQUIDDLY_87 [Gordonia phage Squiddly]
MSSYPTLVDTIAEVLTAADRDNWCLPMDPEQRARALAGRAVANWKYAHRIVSDHELDQLPVHTVVQETPAEHTWIRHSDKWHCSCDGCDVEWTSSGVWDESRIDGGQLHILYLPADPEAGA